MTTNDVRNHICSVLDDSASFMFRRKVVTANPEGGFLIDGKYAGNFFRSGMKCSHWKRVSKTITEHATRRKFSLEGRVLERIKIDSEIYDIPKFCTVITDGHDLVMMGNPIFDNS